MMQTMENNGAKRIKKVKTDSDYFKKKVYAERQLLITGINAFVCCEYPYFNPEKSMWLFSFTIVLLCWVC